MYAFLLSLENTGIDKIIYSKFDLFLSRFSNVVRFSFFEVVLEMLYSIKQ